MSTMTGLAQLLPDDAVAHPDSSVGGAFDGWNSRPEAVVRPRSTEEVAELMKWASREGVGVLATGTGGRTQRPPFGRDAHDAPRGSWIVLSTERLSGIDIYEPADLTLTAGAGTPFADVDAVLRKQNQWAPFDPPMVFERTLGVLVADGASGPLWAGYGELRNHVLGLTVVTGDGRVLRLGGRVVKNVAGFDLVKAMVGSRGRLGIVTSVCIRAFPVPAVDRVLVLPGEAMVELVPTALRVGTAPVLPAATALVDHVVGLGGRAALMVRLHGAASTVGADQASLEQHIGATLELVEGPAAHEVVSLVRDRGADAPSCIELSALPSRMEAVLGAVSELDPVSVVADGYSGAVRVAAPSFDAAAVDSVRGAVERLGGALKLRRWSDPEWPESTRPSPDETDLMRGLHDAFDPAGVLWPARR